MIRHHTRSNTRTICNSKPLYVQWSTLNTLVSSIQYSVRIYRITRKRFTTKVIRHRVIKFNRPPHPYPIHPSTIRNHRIEHALSIQIRVSFEYHSNRVKLFDRRKKLLEFKPKLDSSNSTFSPPFVPFTYKWNTLSNARLHPRTAQDHHGSR